ncbi:uncharacterized protein [Maniola hyperantus]|uniref:uncharacterized protein n=1 Tax=Aphantopus hyperantus TaxID=2795564 RepID=UPI001569CE0D|nr:uncharacterized protein LOC117991436 [Maniola hyperantus]
MAKYLRKFGLSHCDLPTMLWNVAVLLRVNCINIDRNYKRIPWIFYLLNVICCGCHIYAYIFSAIWFTFVRCRETGDYAAAAVEFSIGACSGCASKFIYMHLYSDTVINLVEDYLRCDSLIVPRTRYASNVLKYSRVVKKRATIIWTALVMNGIIYILLPFVTPGRHLTEDLFVVYGLEPMFESPNYEIAMVFLILGVCFAVCTLSNTTMFILTVVGYLEAQMQALSEELLNVWDDSKRFYDKYRTEIEVVNENHLENIIRNLFIKYRLEEVIQFHVLIISLRNKVEKELRYIFIVEFILRFLGTVAELFGGLENTYLELPYTFVQLYMECLIGQRLIDASNVFENSLYECKWENFNIDNRKTVLFMLQCSQKTLTLSAGGMAVLSYSCLMEVMKTTYSAYTTMQSTVDKK